jgi:LysR family glycine cleavage system transcriptional activator
MTQSAVSRQIDAFERAIGRQLFTRSANRVALNPSGELLLTAVQRGFDTIDQALDTITDASPSLLLAANPGFAQQWLVPTSTNSRPSSQTPISASASSTATPS